MSMFVGVDECMYMFVGVDECMSMFVGVDECMYMNKTMQEWYKVRMTDNGILFTWTVSA
jgi:hypothetical protein